jgi:hypothetical protein
MKGLTHMKPDVSPYRPAPGSDPPAMVGRDAELSAAHNAVSMTRHGAPVQPIFFVGLRGMGKTALLRRCVRNAEKDHGIVLGAEASSDLPLSRSLRRSLERAKNESASWGQRIRRALDAAIEALPETTIELPHEMGGVRFSRNERHAEENLVDALEDLNFAVHRSDRYLAITIDEVQEARESDLRSIVTFIHHTAGTAEPVLFLGAGLPNVAASLHAVRTYTERWHYLRLGLLSPAETEEAIQRPAQDHGVSFSDDAIAYLVAETAGYPFFVQEYASAIWLRREGSLVSLGDVEAVAPGVRKLLEDGFYDERFRKLTPREITYAVALAELGSGPHTSGDVAAALGKTSEEVSSIRSQLVRKDVLFASSGLVEFRMPLTDRYIFAHRGELNKRAAIGSSRKTHQR